jgi:hypothetical protein
VLPIRFVGLGLDAAAPDHSTISRTRRLIDVETHRAVFTWVEDSPFKGPFWVGRHRNGLQAGRAEPVHGGAGRRHRQPGAHRRHARDVVALRPVRLAAAEDHVLHFLHVELRHLTEGVLDAMRGEIVGPGQVERSAERLRKGRSRAGDDDGFSHGRFLSSG